MNNRLALRIRLPDQFFSRIKLLISGGSVCQGHELLLALLLDSVASVKEISDKVNTSGACGHLRKTTGIIESKSKSKTCP
jgi:hypothetical protein